MTPTNFSNLTLVAASPSQMETAMINRATKWNADLTKGRVNAASIAQARSTTSEAAAAGLSFARDGGWDMWVLIERSDPSTILASCVTYRRQSLRTRPGQTPESTTSYGVADVFTPPELRRRGYARHMLRLLHYVIAPAEALPPFPAEWGAPPTDVRGDAAFSILNSGIGDAFYRSCTQGLEVPGWVHNPVTLRHWDVDKGRKAGKSGQQAGVEISGAEWVPAEVGALADLEADMDERLRRALPATGDPSKTRLVILSRGQLTFQSVYHGNMSRPGVSNGVYLAAETSSDQPRPLLAYVTAKDDDGKRILWVNHVSGQVPFSAVMAAARKEGADTIEVWGDQGWDQHNPEIMPDELCPCIAVYGIPATEAEWVWCENYTWC